MPVSNPEGLKEPISKNPIIENPVAEMGKSPITPIIEDSIAEEKRLIQGLSQQELNDPNAIEVTIADKKAPIIVLFGPPSCGKTMTLVRLTRYLRKEGFTVTPITTFRPDYDTHYANICEGFNEMINNISASESTNNISFMLVRVSKAGKTLCQILEAPGEYYHDPEHPSVGFPAYVNAVINSDNRKVWTIFVEPSWKNEANRSNYVTKIRTLKQSLFPKDKTIFLFNKIDKTQYVIAPGQIHTRHAINGVSDEYPGVFSLFKNHNPITKWWQEYLCDFVPFQTGTYSKTATGTFTYTQSHDIYPKKLWAAINKLI